MNAPFTSRLADLSDGAGWAQLPSGVWITRLPLFDIANAVLAELTYRDALAAAEAFGARLPTPAEIVELHGFGLELKPVEMPDAAMLKEASISFSDEAAIDAYRNANMMTLTWARLHTEEVHAQLHVLDWDASKPVANAGKHWVAGAPRGRAYLMGWFERGKFTQPAPQIGGQGPHDDGHHDYGTTTVLVRAEAPAAEAA